MHLREGGVLAFAPAAASWDSHKIWCELMNAAGL